VEGEGAMSWWGYGVTRAVSDLIKGELASPRRPGDGYILPDEQARQAACAKLSATAGLDASKVEVTVLSSVLKLAGSVPSAEMKAQAEQVCAAIAGVSKVENTLSVG